MRLVICADGTWNGLHAEGSKEGCATNVVKLATAVLPRDAAGVPQLLCYHPGVGEQGGAWDRFTGGAFGMGISRNILDLYVFICSNYAPGDELFLLGFSRGAYTVRSLAGLVRNCGILRRENLGRAEDAYALYRDRGSDTRPSAELAKAFRAGYAWPDGELRFMGVWDTVGALGIPVRPLRFWTKSLYEFHDVALNSRVAFAYQALAIDERRRSFQPTAWTQQSDAPASQVLEQQWFPGVHCDVGGGYGETGLSDGALAWLWEKAEACGLALDPAHKPVPDPGGPQHDSMTLGFRLLGSVSRVLGATNPLGHEAVAEASRTRMRRLEGYRPANLLAFLASLGG